DTAEREWLFSGDGSRVALFTRPGVLTLPKDGKKTVTVWDVATQKVLLSESSPSNENEDRLPGGSNHNALSHDGKRILLSESIGTGLRAGGWVRVLDLDSGEALFDSRKDQSEQLSGVARLSRDGCKLVTHAFDPEEQFGVATRCKVWNLDAADKNGVTIE